MRWVGRRNVHGGTLEIGRAGIPVLKLQGIVEGRIRQVRESYGLRGPQLRTASRRWVLRAPEDELRVGIGTGRTAIVGGARPGVVRGEWVILECETVVAAQGVVALLYA